MTLQSGDLKFVFHLVYPDVVFYMTYGIVFMWLTGGEKRKT